MILVIRINRVNSSQSSSIAEFGLLVFPFLFVSISDFTYFRPYLWSHVIWSGRRLNFGESLLGPHISFWEVFFQWSELRETFPRI